MLSLSVSLPSLIFFVCIFNVLFFCFNFVTKKYIPFITVFGCEPLLPIWDIYGEEQLLAGNGTPGNVFSLPEPFSVKELEHYLVHTIHSTALDVQLQVSGYSGLQVKEGGEG